MPPYRFRCDAVWMLLARCAMWLLGAPSPPLPLALDRGIRRRSPDPAGPLCSLLVPLEEANGAAAAAAEAVAALAAGEDGLLAAVVLVLPRAAAFSNWARRSGVGLSLTETPRVL